MSSEIDDDSNNLRHLLNDLVYAVTQKYKNQIISIVLFGSATTSEWVKGQSDIDCIVLIKNKNHVNEIEKFLYDKLYELDHIYQLKLSDTCTLNKKTQNSALNLVLRLEKLSMFGKPFYVISEDQIDIRNARITALDDLKIYVGTYVLTSINLFFHRINSTGKILYGTDITREFPKKIPSLEKFKASLNALLLLMMSLILFPIDTRFAFQHAVKDNFWACDNVLFALDMPLSNTQSEIEEIKKLFSDSEKKYHYPIDVNHLQQSIQYKKNPNTRNLSKRFVFRYILKQQNLCGYFITKPYRKYCLINCK